MEKRIFFLVSLYIFIICSCIQKNNKDPEQKAIEINSQKNISSSIKETQKESQLKNKEYKNYLSITSDKIFLVTDGPLNVRKESATTSEILTQLQTYEVVEILEIGKKDIISSIEGIWLKIKKDESEGFIFSGYGLILNGKSFINNIDDFCRIFPENWIVKHKTNWLFEYDEKYVVRLDYSIRTNNKEHHPINLKIYLKPKIIENMDNLIKKYNLKLEVASANFGMGDSYKLVKNSEKLNTLNSDDILYLCREWGSGTSYDILVLLREKTFLDDFEAIQFVYTNIWAKNNEEAWSINNEYIREAREKGNLDSINYQVIIEIMQRVIFN